MTEQLPSFFAIVLTAVAVENAVFTRGLGLGKFALFMKGPRQGILYGVLLTWMATASSVMVAGADNVLADNPYNLYIRAPIFFLCTGVVYVFTYLLARSYFPSRFADIALALPLCTFNTAVFGAFYVSAIQNHTFLETVGYALGTGIGYTLAIFVIYFARKRLAISPVPRSFRGLPILLLYIGLLSLALYGLTGHGLPV